MFDVYISARPPRCGVLVSIQSSYRNDSRGFPQSLDRQHQNVGKMAVTQHGSKPDLGVWKESNGIPDGQDGSRPPPYDHARPQSLELTRETEDRIHSLARVFSNMSKAPSSNTTMVNPFDDHKISALDPFSCDFDAEEWAKHFFHTIGSDPERYPQRTAGVSYRDVAVFGFGSDTDYQKDVVNVMYHAVNVIKESFRPKRRVPILTEFDGLIKSGEMCVVLGRPGRYIEIPYPPPILRLTDAF